MSTQITMAVAETSPHSKPPLSNVTREEAVSFMMNNLNEYEEMIRKARHLYDARLIVFPEYGLYGPYFNSRDAIRPFLEPIPDVDNHTDVINPCLHFSERPELAILHHSSCLAMKYNIYIVLNMGDIQRCPTYEINCTVDGFLQYNTQIALGTDGSLLAKYHKTHLYYESNVFDAGNGKPVYFDTEYGRIGLLICYDLMFISPALDLIYDHSVSVIAFSSWWVNFPPVLNGLQTQQGWSYKHGAIMLGANSGMSWRTSGSGIHINGKTVASVVSDTNKAMNTLLTAPVPIKKQKPSISWKTLFQNKSMLLPSRNENVFSYQTFKLVSGKFYEFHLRSGNVSCHVELKVSQKNFTEESLFMAVVASGYVWPALPCDICGIMSCGGPDDSFCEKVITMNHQTLSSNALVEYLSVEVELSSNSVSAFPALMTSKGENLINDLNDLQIQNFGQKYTMNVSTDKPTLTSIILGIHAQ